MGGQLLRARTPSPLRAGLREAALLLGFLLAYSAIRRAAVDERSGADRNAGAILDLERLLHLDVESAVNAALGQFFPLELVASYWYAALHYTVTPLALVLVYRLRPERYRTLRTALLLPTAVALVGYVLLPTAPPRLLDGYTDTLLATSDLGWWSGEGSAVRGAASAVNQFAAMPSMHVGWALWCSLVFWQLSRGPRQRALAAAYAPVTALVVVATGNHWVLDVLAGAVLVAAAWWLTVGRREPVTPGRPAPAARPPVPGPARPLDDDPAWAAGALGSPAASPPI